MKYRREIDGLRAVAVLPVILFHAGLTFWSGGFVGVDVFFVISGYLITTILIDERERGTYSVLSFYERRARRILPALFLVLIVCIPFAWMWVPPYPFEDFARSLAFAALFISNIHFLEHGGYFDLNADLRPLLHTWSLAVEEQYYLLFPLVLFCLRKFRRTKYLIGFTLLALASLAVAEWGWRNYPSQNFYFTPSRLWEMLAGSLCAAILYQRAQMKSEVLAGLGLAMILYSTVFFDAGLPFPSLLHAGAGGGHLPDHPVCPSRDGDGADPVDRAFRRHRADQLQCLPMAPADLRLCAYPLSRACAGLGDDAACHAGAGAGLGELAVY